MILIRHNNCNIEQDNIYIMYNLFHYHLERLIEIYCSRKSIFHRFRKFFVYKSSSFIPYVSFIHLS